MSVEPHKCFMDEDRQCQATCMAFEESNSKPGCLLLLAANGVIGFLTGWAKAQQSGVKHPASPPPPEVT